MVYKEKILKMRCSIGIFVLFLCATLSFPISGHSPSGTETWVILPVPESEDTLLSGPTIETHIANATRTNIKTIEFNDKIIAHTIPALAIGATAPRSLTLGRRNGPPAHKLEQGAITITFENGRVVTHSVPVRSGAQTTAEIVWIYENAITASTIDGRFLGLIF